jgi:hypothetical protein
MSTVEKALPKPKIELYSGKYFAACGLGGIIGRHAHFFIPAFTGISECTGKASIWLPGSSRQYLLI